MYSLTVLVPAFNEEETIYQSLESLSQIDIFEKALVLNDGSTDSTINEVNKIIDIDNIIIFIFCVSFRWYRNFRP